MKSSFVWFTAVLILGTALVVQSFQGPQKIELDRMQATYSHGVVTVTIPFAGDRAGAGRLIVEVLDPEDRPTARLERDVEIGEAKGAWKEDLKLAAAIPADDLAWHRLRYRFIYADAKGGSVEGTESMSRILRTPVVHVLGQTSYFAGVPAAVRVVATDAENRAIAGRSSLRITLSDHGSEHVLFTGLLNARGTADPQLRFPSALPDGSLHYVVDTPIGSAEITERVRIEDKTSILLTTEKPIYQPGQTMHVRALALNRANHEAAAARGLTFEVQDSRGNKVFKKATQTDKFGVASAEFGLADEVNLGTYHLRAVMEGDDKSEIAFNVERYVLPKFKVAVEFADKAKHGYRPGDHVTGTVRANYFFGKAVSGGEISIKGTGIDVSTFEAGSAHGRTEADGSYRFDLQLPDYFSGRPLAGGAARVLIEATVKDSAGHAETRGEPITISESPLIITAVPEAGALIPNLENQIFVLTSYADGKPAPAEIKLRSSGNPVQTASADENGVAVFRLNAAARESITLDANDKEGNRASKSIRLQMRDGSEQILLRPERAVYRAGDRITLKIFSTKERGTVYVDAVKEGQTVLTRDLDLHNGQAELSLTATPDMSGTVDFNAYSFGSDARPAADHRLVFVQPADELRIDASTDRAAYKPGEDARVRFRVTNTKGEGVQAALGLQVVDEAVFALAEKQPGFAKVFFFLEQEAMKPRFEIHSIGMPEIVEPVPTAQIERRDRAAQALFAATELVSANKFEMAAGKAIGAATYPQFAARFRNQFVRNTPALLTQAYVHHTADLVKAAEAGPEVTDPWGTKLRIERLWTASQFLVRSAGPDKQFDTADDLTMNVVVRGGELLTQTPAAMGGFAVKIDHDRGPANGLAQITGAVFDPTGAVIARANVKIVETSTGKERAATSDDRGGFDLAAVPPGNYDLEISSPGFRGARRRFAIEARDLAIVNATLMIGAVTETVEVAAAPPTRFFAAMAAGRAKAGGAGGVIGGIIGGIPSALPINARETFKDVSPAPAAHVRSYFPEALYINPEIITDRDGYASITIPMADSITTWRMAMLASTTHGALGTGTSSVKVFQDFFADLDLPVTLTQGDRVSIPVAVYNYSGAPGDVGLKLKKEDWFSLVEDTAEKTLTVEPDRVGGSQFTIEAKRIGKFKLTLAANMKTRADIVIREIEVVPNGREKTVVFNGRLDSTASHEVSFPATAIPDANKILVRLYPGPLSQVIEGMDAILRMPAGCFEQTSSSTYPNILALDYMKRMKKSTPEVHANAEGYIANGYQRLLTFEVPGGGFSWFGRAPANKILTAYGLMEFFDMSKVYEVDPKVIQRTQQWLASQQQGDGSWKPDTSFINEGATNRFTNDVLRITAYIGWSLENTGYRGPAVERARQFVEQNMRANTDSYTLAVIANFAADEGRKGAFLNRAIQQLIEAHTEQGEEASWNAEETGVYGRGSSAAIETTGLALQALLKSGEASPVAEKGLRYIASKKDATGAWGSTQATIMALRAVLLSTEKGSADVRGTVEVLVNGSAVEKLVLTAENNDLLHQFPLKNVAANNTVELRFHGTGGLAYQIAGQYFVPWTEDSANEPLSIRVDYDRTTLAQDDIATATALIRNNLNKTANMVMVDLGIPPGFDLLSEDLQDFKEKTASRKTGRLEKFNLTATQAILYFDSIAGSDAVKLKFRLRAKFPIRARTFQSRVYEYYDPEVSAVAQPFQLEVRKR
ncbi:MAG TPA: MG2 domain-containing protein [Bryobacteraceae bacterium]|jgi:hypothetical protein|nr:MG2 domain-containing protein [Bryobacteraceae bacterium]